MHRALQWILIITSTIIINGNAATNDGRADRKLISDSGVISIDCGVNESYKDNTNNFPYQADDNTVVRFGQTGNISSDYENSNPSQIKKQLKSLRSFPDGKRNCYNLKPKQGKNHRYSIRAYFQYGNYDNKNKIPNFDQHLGVNLWGQVELDSATQILRSEAILFSSADTIEYCLVNTNQGVPFISLLELWPLGDSVYQTSSTLLPLMLFTRINLGGSILHFIRYTDDVFGRSWLNKEEYDMNPKNTSSSIDFDTLGETYKLPTEVLNSAIEAVNLSSSLEFMFNYIEDEEYSVYLHFFDFLPNSNQKRIMNISINGLDGVTLTEPLTLAYQKPTTKVMHIEKGKGIDNILIEATSDSELPAMINAFEIFCIIPENFSSTQQDDVDAIRNIRDIYNISRIDWQGDPCGPTGFRWEGLTCGGANIPRIISLNLSSSKLSGRIDDAFSKLTNLEILDLSNNELTGNLPEFLAQLPRLKILSHSQVSKGEVK